MLDVYNGDTLRFICPDGVFSRVEEQVRTATTNQYLIYAKKVIWMGNKKNGPMKLCEPS